MVVKLETLYPINVFVIVAFLHEQEFAKILSQGEGGIISGRQHHAV
jgi:hypothetical protein